MNLKKAFRHTGKGQLQYGEFKDGFMYITDKHVMYKIHPDDCEELKGLDPGFYDMVGTDLVEVELQNQKNVRYDRLIEKHSGDIDWPVFDMLNFRFVQSARQMMYEDPDRSNQNEVVPIVFYEDRAVYKLKKSRMMCVQKGLPMCPKPIKINPLFLYNVMDTLKGHELSTKFHDSPKPIRIEFGKSLVLVFPKWDKK